MKVKLTLTLFISVVSCTADPYLKCTRNELGVLWPNYDDTSEYYQCLNIGQPITMTCNINTFFTFVYQSCTPLSQYIPPPPLAILPTDAPSPGDVTSTPQPGSTASTEPTFTLPTPKWPTGSTPAPSPSPTPTPTSATPTTSTTITTAAPSPDTPPPVTSPPDTPPTVTQPTDAPTTDGGPPTPPIVGTTTPAGPAPPSPPATADVPMPNTPAPTPPAVDVTPPTAPATLPSA